MDALKESRGRRREEEYLVIVKNPFIEDRNRIFHSQGYRKLAYKTQVITAPRNCSVRTRLAHTGEVMSIATTISENLGLNTSLCEAISAGHDVGHAPYGHLGEEVLSEFLGKKYLHHIGSVGLLQSIENKGRGLNLSFETLEGILYHSRPLPGKISVNKDLPEEYNVVMLSDKIAYTFSDINDAIKYGYLEEEKLPNYIKKLGQNQDMRNYRVIKAILDESKRKGNVEFSEGEVYENFCKTRDFMFETVYRKMNHSIKKVILRQVLDFFSHEKHFEGVDPAVCLLSITDQEANEFGKIITEAGKCTLDDIKFFSITYQAQFLRGNKVDLTKPDLDWGKQIIAL